MKTIVKTFSLIAVIAASMPAFSATEVSSRPAGQQPAGAIAESAAGGNLSDLLSRLDARAASEGAVSYRITSAGGRNYLYGTAEIYK